MSDEQGKVKAQEPEETFIKALGLPSLAAASSPEAVDVRDGKMVRLSPLKMR